MRIVTFGYNPCQTIFGIFGIRHRITKYLKEGCCLIKIGLIGSTFLLELFFEKCYSHKYYQNGQGAYLRYRYDMG